MTLLASAPFLRDTTVAPFCIYIPSHNNSSEVGESVASCPADVPIVISDNHSDAEHKGALEGLQDRCTVIFQAGGAGRIENWEFCLRHFLSESQRGGPQWMKWLFAGDTLSTNIEHAFAHAATNYPDARFIVAEHEMIDGNRSKPWRTLGGTQLVEPARALFLAASIGNWFGPPLAYFIHCDAIAHGFDFGDLPWSADFHFCVGVAEAFPVLYLAQSIGVFQMRHRSYYKAHANSARMVLEDSLVRVEAARRYKAITGDYAGFDALLEQIEDFSGRESLRCALMQPDTTPIAEAAARSLGLRRFLQVVFSEGLERLRPTRLPEADANVSASTSEYVPLETK